MLLQNLLDRSSQAGPIQPPSDASDRIYFDFNSTTPLARGIHPGLVELIQNSMEMGNPSSIHWSGRGAKQILRESRAAVAKLIDGHPGEIIFCSGATEASNVVMETVARRFALGESDRNQVLISAVEHPSVVKAAQSLIHFGMDIKMIPVSENGELDMAYFSRNLSAKTALVSVMAANNETGVKYPIGLLTELAHAAGALMHSDMVQMLGREPFSVENLKLDYASFSGHKFYSLKGTGVLYVKKSLPLKTLIQGGPQERGRRGGTENVFGIASLGMMALDTVQKNRVPEKSAHMRALRDELEKRIVSEIQSVKIIGRDQPRIANTSAMTVEGVDGETLLMSLDLKGIAVSTGAACSSGNPEPSPVLLAMGLSRTEAQSSLRVSLGWTTTENEVEIFIREFKVIVDRLRRIHAAGKNLEDGA